MKMDDGLGKTMKFRDTQQGQIKTGLSNTLGMESANEN
jgi:hypothetical protein